jgi:hypothetical protein
VTEIERELAVSRSSVSVWVRDVELGPAQRERLLAVSKLGPLLSAERKAAAAREGRRRYQADGRRLARDRDATYTAGCMLYWAEGSKARNYVKLTNSDPELVVYFLRFLRLHFAVADERVKLALNLFCDHRDHQEEIEAYRLAWLD